jgi:hypothetical protein
MLNHTLADYNINAGATLQMLMKLSGGGAFPSFAGSEADLFEQPVQPSVGAPVIGSEGVTFTLSVFSKTGN